MTTIELEEIVHVGGRQVAALVRRSVVRSGNGRAVRAWFVKRPVAILIGEGGTVRAFDPGGAQIALGEVERLFPGATEAFARRLLDTGRAISDS